MANCRLVFSALGLESAGEIKQKNKETKLTSTSSFQKVIRMLTLKGICHTSAHAQQFDF